MVVWGELSWSVIGVKWRKWGSGPAKSGCRGLLIGFESISQATLEETNKGFHKAVNYLAGLGPTYTVSVGDFNGDGNLDLAATIGKGGAPNDLVAIHNRPALGTHPDMQSFCGNQRQFEVPRCGLLDGRWAESSGPGTLQTVA